MVEIARVTMQARMHWPAARGARRRRMLRGLRVERVRKCVRMEAEGIGALASPAFVGQRRSTSEARAGRLRRTHAPRCTSLHLAAPSTPFFPPLRPRTALFRPTSAYGSMRRGRNARQQCQRGSCVVSCIAGGVWPDGHVALSEHPVPRQRAVRPVAHSPHCPWQIRADQDGMRRASPISPHRQSPVVIIL